MDFRPSEEEEVFRNEIRDFVRELLPPDWLGTDPGLGEEANEDVYPLARKIWHELGMKGWIGISWPRAYGGHEGPLWKELVLTEETAYLGVPGLDIALAEGEMIVQFGTEEQKRRFIPPITRGETKWAMGISEPDAGSDTFALKTVAVEEHDCFRINGQKIWTTNAHHADWCVVYARTDPAVPKYAGISALIVDLGSPGITIRPITEITGVPAFCEVFYDNVRVPRENLLGEKNGASAVLLHAFNAERNSGLFVLQNARRYFEQLVDYYRDTCANRRPLSEDVLIRNRLAQLAIDIEVGCNLGLELDWKVCQGMPTVKESSQIKVYSAGVAQRLANIGMQILGLYGQLDEHSRWVRLAGRMRHTYLSSLSTSIAGGTSEISRNHIAGRYGLGLPRGQ